VGRLGEQNIHLGGGATAPSPLSQCSYVPDPRRLKGQGGGAQSRHPAAPRSMRESSFNLCRIWLIFPTRKGRCFIRATFGWFPFPNFENLSYPKSPIISSHARPLVSDIGPLIFIRRV